MHTILLEIFGVVIEVRVPGRDLLRCLTERFGAYTIANSDRVVNRVTLAREREGLRATFQGRSVHLCLDDSWPRLDDLVLLIVKRERPDLIFVHGSGVILASGCALFVGQSTSGKSTLALALTNCGYPLLSEDRIPVHADSGEAYPFFSAIRLRPGSVSIARERAWRTDAGVASVDQRLPIRFVFCLDMPRSEVCRTVQMETGLASWSKMVELCLPGSASLAVGVPDAMAVQTPDAFDRSPVLVTASPFDAALHLSKHSHAPAMGVGEVLRAWSGLFEESLPFRLCPGRLDETLACVQEILGPPSGSS